MAYNIDKTKAIRAQGYVPVGGNYTAALYTRHLNLANATYTDPATEPGAWFEVSIRSGIATIGGVAYNNEGSIVRREWDGSSWATYEMLSPLDYDGRKIITVSKWDRATDTRTGLNKYDYTHPFATLNAAVTAASAGDTIYVTPGSYTITAPISKNEVNWYFMPGAIVTAPVAVNIFSDLSEAQSYIVSGKGEFIGNFDSGSEVIYLEKSDSVIYFEAKLLKTGDYDTIGEASAVRMKSGKLYLNAYHIESSYDAFWIGNTVGSPDSSANLVVFANRILAYDSAIEINGTASTASISCNEFRGGVDIINGWLSFKALRGDSGNINAETMINAYAGNAYIDILNASVIGRIFNCSDALAGEPNVELTGSFVSTISSIISAGTMRLKGKFDTSDTAINSITKSGGNLILDGVTIITEATGYSVTASSAQNILVYSAVSNKPVHSNITQQVGMIIINSNIL